MLKLKNLSNKLELLFTDVEDKTQINNLYYEACLIKRKQVFLKIFKSVYDQYETLLKENNKYDFSDMIVEASDKIYKCYEDKNFDYKYILVDEFQDISLGRGDFIKKLVAMHEDSKLFVVGDDWQSINRFAGSYLSLMLNFEDEFSEGGTRKSKIIKLNKVYRFNDSISEVSSQFIQENPNQIKKEIIAPPAEEPSVLVWYGEDKRSALIDIISLIYKNIQNEESDEIPSVLVLGRYNLKSDNEYHKELIDTLQYLKEYYENKLDIEYMTIHKAKGLGRDYIVILDLQQGAFPSAQSDDPILDMVMSEKDSYPNGEERRLFYVALTRAKKKVYLYSSMHPSSFLNELTEPDKKYPIFVCNQPDNYAVQKCPVCHTGLMVKPLSDNDKFYYCQNYLCKEKAPACPICNKGFLYEDKELDRIICSNEECGYLAERCPVCGGILLHRYSKSSVLIGCSNYHGKEDSLSCTNINKVMRCRNCWEEGAFLYEVYNHKSQVIERHCSNKNCRKIFR